jgi:hypothetical protein
MPPHGRKPRHARSLAATGAHVIEAQLALASALERCDAAGTSSQMRIVGCCASILDHLVSAARTEVLPGAG